MKSGVFAEGPEVRNIPFRIHNAVKTRIEKIIRRIFFHENPSVFFTFPGMDFCGSEDFFRQFKGDFGFLVIVQRTVCADCPVMDRFSVDDVQRNYLHVHSLGFADRAEIGFSQDVYGIITVLYQQMIVCEILGIEISRERPSDEDAAGLGIQ